MKKIMVILMGLVMMFAFCACGSDSEGGSSDNSADTKTEQAADLSKATIGTYDVSITDYEVTKDDEGEDIIAVTYEFTNNGEEAINFDLALYGQCFQNGIELDFGTIYNGEDSTDPEYDNVYKDIQPGASITVKQAFILQDMENAVTAEVVSMNEIMGGDSEGKAETVFEIAQ